MKPKFLLKIEIRKGFEKERDINRQMFDNFWTISIEFKWIVDGVTAGGKTQEYYT